MDAVPLPTVASCSLDHDGLRAQRDRYREAGIGAALLEHSPRRLLVEIGPGVSTGVLDELIAVERECCPFFEIDWQPSQRLLAVSVASVELAPALDAIASAMELA